MHHAALVIRNPRQRGHKSTAPFRRGARPDGRVSRLGAHALLWHHEQRQSASGRCRTQRRPMYPFQFQPKRQHRIANPFATGCRRMRTSRKAEAMASSVPFTVIRIAQHRRRSPHGIKPIALLFPHPAGPQTRGSMRRARNVPPRTFRPRLHPLRFVGGA